jgi:predicted N-acetyltransferase YhbS
MIMSITIDVCTEEDLEATDAVVMAAYNVRQSRMEALCHHLAFQPDGSFVAKYESAVVGFGAVVDYGLFAYVGLMSVAPSMQKRGIGALMLERLLACLDERGCATVLLDASSAGRSLYERYGFVEDDTTVVLKQTEQTVSPHHIPKDGSISPLASKDIASVIAFDAPCFGTERGNVLAAYWADDPQRALVTHDATGQIAGYVIAQPTVIGPWVARTAEDAEKVLLRVLAFSYESAPNVFVSAQNADAIELLNRYGFTQQRTLSHMRRGKPVQRNRHSALYGQASLGMG